MRGKIESSKTNDGYKTSYQRAHYYVDARESSCPIVDSPDRSKIRPDLYIYDPIINEKSSIYRKSYIEKNSNYANIESYGKLDLTSKYTLKNLYDEYYCKPPKTLSYDKTISGSHYSDPTDTTETQMLRNFCTESSTIEINRSFNGKQSYIDYLNPYESISHYYHRDFCEDREHGIAKNDTITYYYKRGTDRIVPSKKVYEVKPRFFFKVPFASDTSTYAEDFKDPEKKFATLADVCLFPGYFETLKSKIPDIPETNKTRKAN